MDKLEILEKKIKENIKSTIEISNMINKDIEDSEQYQGYCHKTVFIMNVLLDDIEVYKEKLNLK